MRATGVGSVNVTARSSRCANPNCTSIISSIAPDWKRDITMMPMPRPMPSTDMQRAQWPPLEVAQDHARSRVEQRTEAEPLGQRAAEHGRRLGSHRFGGRQQEGAAQAAERAERRRRQRKAESERHDRGPQRPLEEREAVEIHVDAGHAAPQPCAEGEAGQHAQR